MPPHTTDCDLLFTSRVDTVRLSQDLICHSKHFQQSFVAMMQVFSTATLMTCLTDCNSLSWQYLFPTFVIIADGMALVAKGLVQAKPLAMAAYQLIDGILADPKQTSMKDEMLRLLADMQGVRRLSNLLCPTFHDDRGFYARLGRSRMFASPASHSCTVLRFS